MDQITKQQQNQHQSLQDAFSFPFKGKDYKAQLQIVDQMLQITIATEELSQYQWKEFYSIEQLYKMSKYFRQFDDIYEAFDTFKNLLKSKDFDLKIISTKMNLSFSLDQSFQNDKKYQFDIVLTQEKMNVEEAITALCQEIVDLKNQNKLLIHNQDELQKENKGQKESLKTQQISQIEELKSTLKQKDQQIEQMQKRIDDIEISLKTQKRYWNILLEEELEIMNTWINQGARKIELKLIYQATRDGFGIQNIYKQCLNTTPVVLCFKNCNQNRFGGYTDQHIKDHNIQVPLNITNCFHFSLDNKVKYPSKNISCHLGKIPDVLYCFGDSDLEIQTNSNNYQQPIYTPKSNIPAQIQYPNQVQLQFSSMNIKNPNYLSVSQAQNITEIEAFQVIFI